MSQHHDSERGQAIVILALAMVALLAFAALAIDGGNTYVERRRAQNAADAAALAGARQIWIQQSAIPPNGSETSLLVTINQAAENNGITSGPNGDNYPNPNVVAYYTDKDGNVISPIKVGTLLTIPPGVGGIQVKTSRSFSTFIASIINRSNMGAEAQATAVIIPPTGCGSWAIYANASTSCSPADVQISGGGQNIIINNGGVYSNDSLECNTNKATVSYPFVWEYSGSVSNQCTSGGGGTVVQGTVAPPAAWNFNDFKPGGPIATELGSNYHYVNGDLNPPLADGLYFVENGNVSLPSSGRVTIVTTGQIQGSGGSNLSAYYNDLLFFTTSSDTSVGAVRLTGSDIVWQGLIYAPNGSVNMHAASNATLAGAINASCVNMSGAGIDITYDPASCPLQRARVVLLK